MYIENVVYLVSSTPENGNKVLFVFLFSILYIDTLCMFLYLYGHMGAH